MNPPKAQQATIPPMRSERRHQVERLKVKRQYQWGRDLRGDARALGMVVATATPCSCWMCSTRKRGEVSIKTKAASQAWRRIELA